MILRFKYAYNCISTYSNKLHIVYCILHIADADMEFVQNFTPLDFRVKNFTPSISPNFNSFSKKKHNK